MKMILLLIVSVAFAQDDETLRSILKSRSAAELNVETKQGAVSGDVIRLRSVCETQLSMRIIPVSCFSLITQEQQTGLISAAKAASTRDWLSGICEDRARSLASIPSLDATDLPDRCRQAIADRKEDVLYKKTSSDPVSVFRQRF
ncbi:MAG TPA: hypothetical protein VM432_14410 [Bdellovibrionales bacterium]|nr:hypothetical protein [Bdellovibrionales bacterium]